MLTQLTAKPTIRQSGLRALLIFDALTCLMMGAALLGLTRPMMNLTGLPAGVLTIAGLLLLPIAAFMVVAAIQRGGSILPARIVVLGNGAWVVASLILLLVVPVSAFGLVVVLLQAAAVALLAVLEERALRCIRAT